MCMEACAHTMRMEACARTYVLHTPYKSVQDMYVNGQVGISIKLSDVYC